MAITLGQAQLPFTVLLAEGADFVATITYDDGDYPGGLSVDLKFDDPDDTVWPATIVGDTLTWDVDKAEVATLISGDPKRAIVTWTDGALDLIWMRGRVSISRSL